MLPKVIISGVLKLVTKQFKLDKVLKYVEEPNEVDEKVDNLNNRVKILEAMAHEPREFISCKKCDEEVKIDKKDKKWYDKE